MLIVYFLYLVNVWYFVWCNNSDGVCDCVCYYVYDCFCECECVCGYDCVCSCNVF